VRGIDVNRLAAILVLGGVALGMMACEGTVEDPASDSSSRSEAGIDAQVVASGVDAQTPRWTVSTEPELTLGTEDGDGTETFSGIAYAARLADGRVLVLDGGSSEIRIFDSHGHFLVRRGGRGQGPGEFREFSQVTLQEGERLVVYDRFAGRVTTWQINGGDVETGPLRSLTNSGRPDWRFVGVAGNDRYVIAQAPESLDEVMQLPSGDTLRYRMDVVLTNSTDVGPERIASTFGPLRVAFVFSLAQPGGRPPPRRIVPLPLTHDVLAVTDGRRVVLSRTDRYEFLVVELETNNHQLWRRSDIEPELIDTRVVERYESLGIRPGMVPEGGTEPQFVEFPMELLIGAPLETHSRIVLDDVGRMWVRGPEFPWDEGPPSEWTVFGEDGRIVAVVSLPAGLDVFHIGEGYVTGRVGGSLGVEYVAVHRILRE
jgi:hypothetical protein